VKKLIALALLAVCAGIAWFQWGANKPLPAQSSSAIASAATASAGALPPSSVLKIDPSLGAKTNVNSAVVTAQSRRGQLPPVISPLLSDYLARKDLPALMAKVSQLPNDGEALFIRAQLLSRCAKRTDISEPPGKSLEERRAAFVAGLSPTHPETAQRIAAYDAANTDSCGPLRVIETTAKEIAELLARASELKDATALARDVNCEIFASADQSAKGANRAAEITDQRFERVRQAIATRNPIAVRAGVGMLANTYRNGTFRLGNDGVNIDSNSMFHAANILACQYGADCNADVLRACANDGKCRANNYDDYMAYYQLSPNEAQTVEAYRAQLTQMIDSKDFSQLRLIKGDQPTDSVRTGSYFACTP
jgi:hypothetical protein